MAIVSTFSGVGGLDVGLERVRWFGRTVVQAELGAYQRRVLERRWPDARHVGDVRELLSIDLGDVDVLAGGFPCQPVSDAGQRRAQLDERWLWPIMRDVVEHARPRYVVVENVDGLRRRGLYDVLRDLDALGYGVEWDLIPAAAVGAPHLRERFFLVAWRADCPLGLVFRSAPAVSPWWVDHAEPLPRLQRDRGEFARARLEALGNAVVPQVAEHVGRCLAAAVGSSYSPVHTVSLATWAPRAVAAPVVALDLFGGEQVLDAIDSTPELPWHGRLERGHVCELPRSFPAALAGRRLWPTPCANEAEWSVEALARTVDKDGAPASDPHARLYHADTGQIVQRTLTNYARGVDVGLWPEPDDVGAAIAGGLWPTPVAHDARPGHAHRDGRDNGGGCSNLVDRVVATADRELWPTPTSNLGKAGPDYARDGRPRSGSDDLATAAARDTSATGRLSPPWVEWLMGFDPGWTDLE